MPANHTQLDDVNELYAGSVIVVGITGHRTIRATALLPGDHVRFPGSDTTMAIAWIASPVQHRHLRLLGVDGQPFAMAVPGDTEFHLEHGWRWGTCRCLLCQRTTGYLYDDATTTSAMNGICGPCDTRVQDEVIREAAASS